MVQAEAHAAGIAAVTANASVIRAPFSILGIIERIEADPEAYRRLAASVASELSRELELRPSNTPNEQDRRQEFDAVTQEIARYRDGFDAVAAAIAAGISTADARVKQSAFERAASVVIVMRDGLVKWCKAYSLPKILVIGSAVITLHRFGDTSGDLALLASYAVVERVDLAALLKTYFDGRKK